MRKHAFHFNTRSTRTQLSLIKRGLRPVLLLAAGCLLLHTAKSFAQEIQYAKNAPDYTLRSGLRVDPASRALSIDIPLGSYPGRGGMSMPISITYSSKVWNIEFDGELEDQFNRPYWTYLAQYSGERDRAGWTSSLDPPRIQESFEGYDDFTGQPGGISGHIQCVARIHVLMPGGSRVELRQNDLPQYGCQRSGTYYSVDGSRMRYDYDSRTLFLPDGSRYIFSVPGAGRPSEVHLYIDRHGNTLTYNSAARQWTDTLGRTFGLPLQSEPPANVDISGGDFPYTVPGIGGTPMTYTLRWRRLRDPQTGESVLTDPTQELRLSGDFDCGSIPQQPVSPSLFASNKRNSICTFGTERFNPVVLAEVVLPNNTSYRFTYNVWGEIDKVTYPTGGYERYVYAKVPPMTYMKFPYSEANRGVSERRVSHDGTAASEVVWKYGTEYTPGTSGPYVSTVTAPDGTVTKTSLHAHPQNYGHVNRSAPFGFEDARIGMAYEERVFAPASQGGAMLRRSLTEFAYESTLINIPAGGTTQATRNPRPVREVSLILDTGGNALAKMITYQYAATYPSAEFTIGLDRTGITEPHFLEIGQTTAHTATIGAIAANSFPPASSSVTTFLDDPAYLDRYILGLPTAVILKDANGQAVSKTETFYDEAAYRPVSYADLAGVPHYTDPGPDAPRATPTTVRSYVDIAANLYLETHARFDQCGNSVDFWNERGVLSSHKEYSAEYKRAYQTRETTAVPDPTGVHGSAQPFASNSTYDLVTGLPLTTTNINGHTVSFSYADDTGAPDPLNRLRKVTRPDGSWTKYHFNDMPGNLFIRTETSMDETRSTQTYQYFDNLGRVTRSLSSEGGANYMASDIKYDQMGRVERRSYPYRTQDLDSMSRGNLWTINAYDVLGRVKLVTAPDGTTVETRYEGIYTTATDEAGKKRRQKVDALGRIVRVDEADAEGNLGAVNAPVQATYYDYDTLGNIIHIQQGTGSNTQHRYFAYDALSRLTYERHVEQVGRHQFNDSLSGNGSWSRKLVYDETVDNVSYKGLLTSAHDARGIRTRIRYDQLNRAVRTSYTDGTSEVTKKYDQQRNDPQTSQPYFNKGQLTEVSTVALAGMPGTMIAYDYNLMGRVTGHRQTVGDMTYGFKYGYNLGGQMVSQTYPSGRALSYDYDDGARLSAVEGGATSYASAFAFNNHGLPESFALGNGAVYSMGYNARLQVANISLVKGGVTTQRYEYKYGRVNPTTGAVDETKNNGQVGSIESWFSVKSSSMGMILSKQWQQRFSYDSLGRLSAAGEFRGDNNQTTYLLNYDYDLYGNRYQKQARNSGNPFIQHWVEDNAFDPLTNRFRSGVTYDEAGNIISDTRFRNQEFQYDANNRQRQRSNLDGTDPVVSVYDGTGQRVAMMTNGQITDIKVYDATGALAAEYEQSLTTGGGTQYVMGDHQGSPRVVMMSDGRLSRHDYLPYGEEFLVAGVGLRTTGQGYDREDGVRKRYAGMEEEDTPGMTHTLWRKLDSYAGRWTSPDPYGGSMEVTTPQTFNRYTYANNDPVNQADPTGLCPPNSDSQSVLLKNADDYVRRLLEPILNMARDQAYEFRNMVHGTQRIGDQRAEGQQTGRQEPAPSPRPTEGETESNNFSIFSLDGEEVWRFDIFRGIDLKPEDPMARFRERNYDQCVEKVQALQLELSKDMWAFDLDPSDVTGAGGGALTAAQRARQLSNLRRGLLVGVGGLGGLVVDKGLDIGVQAGATAAAVGEGVSLFKSHCVQLFGNWPAIREERAIQKRRQESFLRDLEYKRKQDAGRIKLGLPIDPPVRRMF